MRAICYIFFLLFSFVYAWGQITQTQPKITNNLVNKPGIITETDRSIAESMLLNGPHWNKINELKMIKANYPQLSQSVETKTEKTFKDRTKTVKLKTDVVNPVFSKQLFNNALDEIIEMLEGKKGISFKRAVYLTENAYMGGTLDWEEFNYQITSVVPILNQMIMDKV